MVSIKIDSNAPIVAQLITVFAGRLRHWTVPLKAFGRIVVRSVTENFEQEGRPKAWRPLTDATVLARVGRGRASGSRSRARSGSRRRASTVRILQHRGLLKNSARPEVSGNTLRVGPAGPAAIYAAIHQFGGKAGRGRTVNIPARPFLMVQPEDETELVDLVRQQIERERP